MSNGITGLIPTIMAVELIDDNLHEMKKKKPKIVKQGIKNIIGISLIGATSKLI